MAGSGYKDWVAGTKPTAAEFDTYLQEQTVMQFASNSARDTALSAVLDEGLHTTQADTNCDTVYSGSAWSTQGPMYGGGLAWTPAVTQSGSVTVTVNQASYFRMGRMVTAFFFLSVTGTGTASNAITITLPVNAQYSSFVVPCGNAILLDASTTNLYTAVARLASATTFVMYNSSTPSADPRLGVGGFTAALASGDQISGMLVYEAAADA
jgi:hypothetical protein